MDNKVMTAVFEGGRADSKIERQMRDVRHAVLLDNLQKLYNTEGLGDIVLISNYPDLLARAENEGRVISRDISHRDFHFGRELQELVADYKPEKLFYLGAASFPLIQEEELVNVVSVIQSRDNFVYTNNPQSSDLAAFSPAKAIFDIEPPESDNSLAISLRDQAGLEMELMPHSRGIFFDLDTPVDFLILSDSSYVGRRTREALAAMPLDHELLNKAKEVLRGYYRDVAVIGRIGAPLIAHLNCNLKLRLRIFSEERGMKALGREAAGEVELLLCYLMEEVGVEKFFRYLEKVAELAIIDTRVLFAHRKLKLPAEQRYFADLGRWEQLNDPWLKSFVKAAVNSAIPVLMGGHSLVSGGLWVLADELL